MHQHIMHDLVEAHSPTDRKRIIRADGIESDSEDGPWRKVRADRIVRKRFTTIRFSYTKPN